MYRQINFIFETNLGFASGDQVGAFDEISRIKKKSLAKELLTYHISSAVSEYQPVDVRAVLRNRNNLFRLRLQLRLSKKFRSGAGSDFSFLGTCFHSF
jgi:hypothetical protein